MAAGASMAVMAMTSIASSVAQASAAKTQGEFAKQQAEQNARLAEMQASETEQAGERESSQYMRKVRAMVGSQKAAMAAKGIDIGSGTALDVFGDTAAFGAEDAETIRRNAYRQAFGIRQQAQNTRNQGQFDFMAARNEARNTLLTGGMQAINYGVQGFGEVQKARNTPNTYEQGISSGTLYGPARPPKR